MSQLSHPFLRFEMIKFQIPSSKQSLDLSQMKSEIEIKEKNLSTQLNSASKKQFFVDLSFHLNDLKPKSKNPSIMKQINVFDLMWD